MSRNNTSHHLDDISWPAVRIATDITTSLPTSRETTTVRTAGGKKSGANRGENLKRRSMKMKTKTIPEWNTIQLLHSPTHEAAAW